MQRFQQLLFAVSLVALSWFAMMAVHELDHVIGAFVTGGSIRRVVLYPLTISRTDVSPNHHPAVVVWLGPIVGCFLPLAAAEVVPLHRVALRNIARFFAGFCLIANGAYISIGAFSRVGDCGEMLQAGTPLWALLAFGTVTVLLGMFIWHRLGSLGNFIDNPSIVTSKVTYSVLSALLVLLVVEFTLSPR